MLKLLNLYASYDTFEIILGRMGGKKIFLGQMPPMPPVGPPLDIKHQLAEYLSFTNKGWGETRGHDNVTMSFPRLQNANMIHNSWHVFIFLLQEEDQHTTIYCVLYECPGVNWNCTTYFDTGEKCDKILWWKIFTAMGILVLVLCYRRDLKLGRKCKNVCSVRPLLTFLCPSTGIDCLKIQKNCSTIRRVF